MRRPGLVHRPGEGTSLRGEPGVVARPTTGLFSVFLGRCCLGSRIERYIILEHAEHDHGEFARQRHLGLVLMPARRAIRIAQLLSSEQPLIGLVNMMWAAS